MVRAFAVTALPGPTTFGRAAVVDGYLFRAGGRSQVFGGAASAQVCAAPILDGGRLGPWTAQPSMPAGRSNQAIAVGGDFLYATGEANGGPGDAQVFAARVRFPR